VDGIPVHRVDLPSGWRSRPAFYRRLTHYCAQKRTDIDVVQFLSLDAWAAPWLWRLRRQGVGIVFTHTLLGDLSANRWKQALQRVHRRSPLHFVDRVVVSSSVMQRQLERLHTSAPIQVIPNGVDLQRFRPAASLHDKTALRRQLGLDPGWEVILTVGPIIPRKGVERVVQAFVSTCHQYPRARLILVGPRHDQTRAALSEFSRQLQHTIATAGAQDRVMFTGPVANVQDYMRAADMMVFASRREGMPNVVPEAMACGLPVIMTPFIGLPEEFGRPDRHYILSSWDVETLAADMRMLLQQARRRQCLGESARQWAVENLDVHHSLNDYAALYRNLKAKSRSKRGRGNL
jgi:glycosyltransferase involved in cell wall biosynthesis